MGLVKLDGSTGTDEAIRLVFEMMIWFAMGAVFAAVFPIGPVAGVVGFFIYRRGVRSPWTYGFVGAVSALVAPVLLIVIGYETMRYPSDINLAVLSEAGVLAFATAFAVIGAFAGYMAGRVLRCG